MGGDFFPNRYFPDVYFPGRYFQGGEENPGAMSASLSGSGSLTGTLIGVEAQEEIRGKGGWDPHYYKRRNKRRDKRKDIEQFVQEVAQAPLELAPEPIREQAEDALEAARLALALEEIEAIRKALREINEFYALLRAEAKRLRDEEDAEEEELLLLAA